MKKEKLLFLFDLVDCITEDLAKEPIEKVANEHGLSFEALKIGNDEVVIYEGESNMYVAIGGSSGDKKEWRSNFNPYPLVLGTHRGIYESSSEILDVIRNTIEGTHRNLIWIGYSRGGGLAQDCCCRSRGEVVHFGSMRPYSLKKTRQLERNPKYKSHAVMGKGDGVTRLPWAWIPPFWKTHCTSKTVLGRTLGLDHIQYRRMLEKE